MNRVRIKLDSPYVGLRPFDVKEAVLFFGRDEHVQGLLEKLNRAHRFIAVLGASGTGKSSLVRAGLLPALHRGALEGKTGWNVATCKPGDSPLSNLAEALGADSRWLDGSDRRAAVLALTSLLASSPLALRDLFRQKATLFGAEKILLVVDQFEELFRYQQRDRNEADAFVKLLLRSAEEDAPFYLVITMRSDFLGHCSSFFGLPEAINESTYLTPRLAREQVKSVIAAPLGLVGGSIDPILVNRLVNSTRGDDELPILEHALLRMWKRASEEGRTNIASEDFESVCAPPPSVDGSPGGEPDVGHAIDAHASSVYAALSPRQQALARRVFLSLVERREGRDVRRPQPYGQLALVAEEAEAADLRAVIDAFRAGDAGFLTPAPPTELHPGTVVDIGHESLMRRWRLLRQWLDEEHQDIAELIEWYQRSTRQKTGGGWLDERDCVRAEAWRERVQQRWIMTGWAARYFDLDAAVLIVAYVQESATRVRKQAEDQRRLERLESQEAARAQEVKLKAKSQWVKRLGFGFTVVLVFAVVAAFQAQRATKAEAVADEANARAQSAKVDEERAREETERALATAQASERLYQEAVTALREGVKEQGSKPSEEEQAKIDTVLRALVPRVYLQITDEDQRDSAGRLRTRIAQLILNDSSVQAPGVAKQPSTRNLLRCFTAADCAEAPDLLKLINAQLAAPKLEIQDLSRRYEDSPNIRPRHFEVWLAPGAITLAGESFPQSQGAELPPPSPPDFSKLVISPATLEFPLQDMATRGVERKFVITNDTDREWDVRFEESQDGDGWRHFDFNLYQACHLAIQGSCTNSLTLDPQSSGKHSLSLIGTATSSRGDRGPLVITAAAEVIPRRWHFEVESDAEQPIIDAEGSASLTLRFGAGTSRGERELSLINPLDRPVTVDGHRLIGSALERAFIKDDECIGKTLKPRQSCEIEIEFEPFPGDKGGEKYDDYVYYYEKGTDDRTYGRRLELHLLAVSSP